MADIEKQDIAQRDIEQLVAAARAKNGTIDARVALDIIVEKLRNSTGYYKWATLGEDAERTWLYRIPREDLEEELWLKEEPSDLLHICNPVKFLEAVEARDKEGSSDHCGYVRDSDSKLADDTSMKCARCKRAMPEKLAKAGLIQHKLHRLGKAR